MLVAICVVAQLLHAAQVLLHRLSTFGSVRTSRVMPSSVDPVSDSWTAHLSVWKANSELLHQDRQDLVEGRASLAGYQSGKVACLACCVSVYFRWLWLTVSHGYQTHKRPMRFWLANYHGSDGGGKKWREQQELAKNGRGREGIEGTVRMPNLSYYHARDSVISPAFSLSVYLVWDWLVSCSSGLWVQWCPPGFGAYCARLPSGPARTAALFTTDRKCSLEGSFMTAEIFIIWWGTHCQHIDTIFGGVFTPSNGIFVT